MLKYKNNSRKTTLAMPTNTLTVYGPDLEAHLQLYRKTAQYTYGDGPDDQLNGRALALLCDDILKSDNLPGDIKRLVMRVSGACKDFANNFYKLSDDMCSAVSDTIFILTEESSMESATQTCEEFIIEVNLATQQARDDQLKLQDDQLKLQDDRIAFLHNKVEALTLAGAPPVSDNSLFIPADLAGKFYGKGGAHIKAFKAKYLLTNILVKKSDSGLNVTLYANTCNKTLKASAISALQEFIQSSEVTWAT